MAAIFQRHGGKIVFFGRFVALLRSLAALRAGLNQMSWHRFVIFNAAGGILGAACYALAAFYFGKSIEAFTRPVGLAVLLVGIILLRRRRKIWSNLPRTWLRFASDLEASQCQGQESS
jgi:membrane protein DedA with SNARE-associated domain